MKSMAKWLYVLVAMILSVTSFGWKALASENGMVTVNYVTENSVSLNFYSTMGLVKHMDVKQDGNVIYSVDSPGVTFDYLVSGLHPATTYTIQYEGTNNQNAAINDEITVTTEAIPDEPETIGPILPDNQGADVETAPVNDDLTSATSTGVTVDRYYEGVKRTSGWDLVGSDAINGSMVHWGSTIYSTGGSFKIVSKGLSVAGSGTTYTLTLYEYDSASKSSKVKTWYNVDVRTDRTLQIDNASNYIDGDNHKAEFYFMVDIYYTPSSGYTNFLYYD